MQHMKKYKTFLEMAHIAENLQQAYLCYENANFYCTDDSVECQNLCWNEMEKLRIDAEIVVPKTAIVIVSYNNAELMKACVESIRKNCSASAYHLIVVDNASSDGIVTWLRKQRDITLVENEKNMGFPYACNQGIAMAESDEDIFLLNNDTIVPPDALFWLRMGLYENEHIGAVGSVSNSVVNYQQVEEKFDTIAEWMSYAQQKNVYMEHPYEKKGWLVGFAMLIKRKALDALLCAEEKQIGQLHEVLDTRFSPGNFEDNDLSIRLLLRGYELLLCRNSFIFHHGGKSFGKNAPQYIKLLHENQKKLEQKYGIDYVPFGRIETALVDLIKDEAEDEIEVLELGCKLGATLARIQSRYPNANICGTEVREKLAILAKHVVPLRKENELIMENYDYVILDQILEAVDQPGGLLERAKKLLKKEGKLLVSVRNRQCVHEESTGFSLDEIVNLFEMCGLKLQEFNYRALQCSKKEQDRLEKIRSHVAPSEMPLYVAEKYVFSAVKKS